jgi:TolA-binding protein
MFDLYPDQPYYDHAIFLIGESYLREQNFKKAAEAYNYLLEHYPKSLLVKESRQRLKDLPKS